MKSTSETRYRDLNASGALPEGHEGRFVRLSVMAIASAMFALLLWAAVTPVDEITSGFGTITTQARPERVEHPDGGTVSAIAVKPGQFVQAGHRLLEFDTSSLQREMRKLQASRSALEAELGRVDYVLEGKGYIPAFTEVDELSPKELLFWAEQSYLDAQLGLIDADSRATLPTIDNLNERRGNLLREIEFVRARRDRNRAGYKTGAIALSAVEVLEREYLQVQRTLLELENELSALQSALAFNQLRKVEVRAKRNR